MKKLTFIFIFLQAFILTGVSQSSVSVQSFPGGFLENRDANVVRPKFDTTVIAQFMPQRGLFTFPAPYNTQGIRITNRGDCPPNIPDCVSAVEYSYWRNMNNHVKEDSILIALKLFYGQWDERITLFSYNKLTDQVRNLGPLYNKGPAIGINAGTIYFSAKSPHMLYIKTWSALVRLDVITKVVDTVFDIKKKPIKGMMSTDKFIWQVNSSDDDRMHSFTLKQDDSTYEDLGAAVYDELKDTVYFFPRTACYYDECQIDKSGNWLIIKENQCDANPQFDGRIVDLRTMLQTKTLNIDSNHIGHSDCGWGYAVASDNALNTPLGKSLVRLNKPFNPLCVDSASGWWNYKNCGKGGEHIAHGNAVDTNIVPIKDQYAIASGIGGTYSCARTNEVFAMRLNGSKQLLIVAPVLTDSDNDTVHAEYGLSPKANIDVTGKYCIWTSNLGTQRFDILMAKIPSELLVPDGVHPIVHTDAQFKIMPNPAKDKVMIVVNDFANNTYVDLVDLTGQRLRRILLTQASSSISLDGLSRGLYFLGYNKQYVKLVVE